MRRFHCGGFGLFLGLGFETGYLLGATSKRLPHIDGKCNGTVSLLITGNIHANCTLVPYDAVEEAKQLITRNLILR